MKELIPFDKVLVRQSEKDKWRPRIFEQLFDNRYYCQDGNDYEYCIKYEGNEHLVGTTNKPKEDLPIDTPVMCYNRETEEWILMYYAGHNFTFCKGKSSEGNSQCTWSIIIPVDNFDFENPKNSLKYNIVK